jgi:hypothetical protein
MEMEYDVKIKVPQIKFEMDNVPFMDGQQLSESCVLYESPQTSIVKEESERLQYSAEIH